MVDENIFTSQTPATQNFDAQGVTLGTGFKTAVNGTIKGVRFYATSTLSGGTYTAALYSVDTADAGSDDPGTGTGTLLASVNFGTLTANTWNTATFSSAVSVTAGTPYKAVVYSSVGRYCSSSALFTSDLVNGNLTGIANNTSAGGKNVRNGTYQFNASLAYPNDHFSTEGYFVDPIFAASATTVTKDTVEVYRVFNSVTKDTVESYRVLNAITKNQAESYRVFNAITKNQTESYRVTNTITKDTVEVYRVLNAGTKDTVESYRVTNLITKDTVETYRVLNTVQKNQAEVYRVFNAVTKDTVERYDVLSGTSVQKDTVESYRVFNQVTKDTVESYRITNQVTKNQSESYRVLNAITKDTVDVYRITNTIQKDVVEHYDVLGGTAQTKSVVESYRIFNSIQKDTTDRYRILNKLTKDTIERYRIFNAGTLSTSVWSLDEVEVPATIEGLWNGHTVIPCTIELSS